VSIPLLGYIYFGFSFVPVVVGLFRYRKMSTPMRLLTALCALAVVNVVTSLILGRMKINNQLIANVYVPVELILITSVYYLSTVAGRSKRVLLGSASLFVFVWLVDVTFFEPLTEMNSTMAAISRLFLIAQSFMMITVVSRESAVQMSKSAVFWVASGVILYSTGTFIVAGLGNRLLEIDVSLFVVAWHINWMLLIMANLLYTKGMLCEYQT
jgi:hypothetical protein